MGGLFDIPVLKKKLEELNEVVVLPNFWDDVNQANKTYQQLKNIKKEIDSYEELLISIELYTELLDTDSVSSADIKELETKISELEINTLLSGPYDMNACYLEIHPGAGGTESCDWASMLERMYERFFDKNEYHYQVIDKQEGEEAGIKNVTLFVEGSYAYGYLKNEKGVHRLVSISPFDANKRRHTSFASVSVTPQFNNDILVDIREEDLKIDVYHSSGAGGQSVNTSNSAVRITHLPTKIVVTCQNERSQLRNKEIAMWLLKNKLFQKKLEEQEEKLKQIQGDVSNIDFGSQIRSYVLEPYKLVKDHRTNYESNDPDKVLDGDIMPFILASLKQT